MPKKRKIKRRPQRKTQVKRDNRISKTYYILTRMETFLESLCSLYDGECGNCPLNDICDELNHLIRREKRRLESVLYRKNNLCDVEKRSIQNG